MVQQHFGSRMHLPFVRVGLDNHTLVIKRELLELFLDDQQLSAVVVYRESRGQPIISHYTIVKADEMN